MNRLREEIRIIPRAAWVIAFLVYLCLMIVLTRATYVGHSADLRNMSIILKVLFAKILPLIPFLLVLLIGYVNADARRRGMRYIMWTVLAIFLPQAMGIILYFIFRDPLPKQCSKCGGSVRGGFAFCPSCGTTVTPACPQCKRTVEVQWSHCASCGKKLASPDAGSADPAAAAHPVTGQA